MSLSSDWFSTPVAIRRYSSTIQNLSEINGAYTTLYAALPTFVTGLASDLESTMLGQFGLKNFQLVWRVDDIDDEKGWPQVGDVASLAGEQFLIVKLTEHIHIPGFFTLPAHKAAFIGESLVPI